MRKVMASILVAILLVSGLLLGCVLSVTGSGQLDTREMDFSGFTRIEASHGFDVEIVQSDAYSVSITADDNLFDEDIRVSKAGETLKIGLRLNASYHSITLKARITMPDLHGVELSGGSRADITGFSSSHAFSIELSGGSLITGDITAGDAEFDLSGGSQVNLEGTAEDLDVQGSGGSQLNLEAFPVDNADIDLSGGSKVTINVTGTLDINLSGGSRVTYDGEPTLGEIDLSGDSTISQK